MKLQAASYKLQAASCKLQAKKKRPPQYPTLFGLPTTQNKAKMWNIVPRATARSCKKRSDSFSFYN